jgi:hypothetical protein
VSEYAAKVAARAAARRRACELRELARDLKACGDAIDRLGLTGADRLREDAARFARLASDIEAALRARA